MINPNIIMNTYMIPLPLQNKSHIIIIKKAILLLLLQKVLSYAPLSANNIVRLYINYPYRRILHILCNTYVIKSPYIVFVIAYL